MTDKKHILSKMSTKERRVIIIPIGLELDRAIFGLSIYKPDMVYAIYSRKDEIKPIKKIDVESERFKEFFVNKIRGFWKYEDIGIDVTNLSKCTKTLKEIITKEMEINQNTSFIINISSSSKIFSFASFYLAGKFSGQILLYYVKPTSYLMVDFVNYFQELVEFLKEGKKIDINKIQEAENMLNKYREQGWTSGPFEIIEIPYYKLSKYPNDEIKILGIMNLNKDKYPDGFTIEIILRLMNENAEIRDNKIKLNYRLIELKKKGLIENFVKNRKKYLKLGKAGEIFLETIAYIMED